LKDVLLQIAGVDEEVKGEGVREWRGIVYMPKRFIFKPRDSF
jgi:hypothetical protein